MDDKHLPANIPKRLLDEREAAEYCHVSPPSLWKLVENGLLPPPVRLSNGKGVVLSRTLWDRKAIDLALDLLSGIGEPSSRSNSKIREAIDGRRAKVRNSAA